MTKEYEGLADGKVVERTDIRPRSPANLKQRAAAYLSTLARETIDQFVEAGLMENGDDRITFRVDHCFLFVFWSRYIGKEMISRQSVISVREVDSSVDPIGRIKTFARTSIYDIQGLINHVRLQSESRGGPIEGQDDPSAPNNNRDVSLPPGEASSPPSVP